MLEGEELPDTILEHYKAYTAMKIDFRIFSYALESIGGADEELICRYIMNDIDLTGIAEERTISYQTAKGKIRDLKKLLKERTLCYLESTKIIVNLEIQKSEPTKYHILKPFHKWNA